MQVELMEFSSKLFMMWFLPIVLLVYYCAPRVLKNWVLLLASFAFIAEIHARLSVIIFGSLFANYLCGLSIFRRQHLGLSLWLPVTLSVAMSTTLLFLCRCSHCLPSEWIAFLHSCGWMQELVNDSTFSIAVSVVTLHSISFVIDVARGEADRQACPQSLGLYTTMFPQLIAGPLVRYRDAVDQLTDRKISRAEFMDGIRRFVIGLGKKAIIADTLAQSVQDVFNTPTEHLASDAAWLGLISFGLQLYFLWSGLADMAVGLGKMFGFNLPENFNYPYVATSITDFWRRWNISLTLWLYTYVSIPIGGSRVAKWRLLRNVLVVSALGGLWYGVRWNFLVWGLFHGAFLIVERLMKPLVRSPQRFAFCWSIARRVYFVAVLLVGWLIFRSDSLVDAQQLASQLLSIGPAGQQVHATSFLDRWTALVLAIAIIGSTPVTEFFRSLAGELAAGSKLRFAGRGLHACGWVALYPVLIMSIGLLCGRSIESLP